MDAVLYFHLMCRSSAACAVALLICTACRLEYVNVVEVGLGEAMMNG